jgi:hypothetical protein
MKNVLGYLHDFRRYDDGVRLAQFFEFDRLFRREFRTRVNLELNTP